ncbi:acetyl-CoA synthetase-like protein [Aspergillus ellipticus CBS 707.79]|uniref:Acetyl-CoA synthetase-like protein n=1 Tax=Aspergillus ellipticus CBS 707.79 TaxID=1448320 RepID=A0A319CWW0_9EURO|nr:acetyl-CoA synthetase-like protein [Aspergillus ellipticus CBS 707.79]
MGKRRDKQTSTALTTYKGDPARGGAGRAKCGGPTGRHWPHPGPIVSGSESHPQSLSRLVRPSEGPCGQVNGPQKKPPRAVTPLDLADSCFCQWFWILVSPGRVYFGNRVIRYQVPISLAFRHAGDYVLQSVLLLSDDICLEDFKTAWQQAISVIPILRTRLVHHHQFGHLQVVLSNSLDWKQSTDELESFLVQDKDQVMEFGLPLSRFTFVGKQTRPRWLVWTAHHALYDGWSLPLIVDMVEDAYLGKPLPNQKNFTPFVKYLQDTNQDEAHAYWKSALAKYDSAPFPDMHTAIHKPMADKTMERVCDLSQNGRSEATLSTLIRATLGILISRHANSPDVVFGAVLSGRNAPVHEVEKIIGPTITTVPVRAQLPTEQRVSEYLRILEHQAVEMIPFEQTGLQNIARMNKSACNFQTLLVIQPGDQHKDEGHRTFGTWITDPEQHGFTTYALTLQVSPPTATEGVRVKASFDSKVITSWIMERMVDQFISILRQLIDASPEQMVSDIDLLTSQDRTMLWEANKTVPRQVDACVHNLIRERTKMQPDAVALSSWDGQMTYKELDILSDRLAQNLISLANPGSLVPLCFEKSIWTVVAMLESMKSGFGSVTMDITQPAQRLQTIVQRIDPPLILSSIANEKLASELLPGKPVVVVGKYTLTQMRPSLDVQLPVISPSSTICVLFTSGNTGLPKGAVITHSNFATGIKIQAAPFGYALGARIFAFASYSFDISWFDIIHALASGSTLCIPSEADRKDDLEGSVARSKATVAFLTPSVARLIRPDAVPSLRFLLLGGEPQRWSDFSSWSYYVTKLSIYGPAECTVVSSAEDAHILQKRDMTLPSTIGLTAWLVDLSNDHLLSPVGSVLSKTPPGYYKAGAPTIRVDMIGFIGLVTMQDTMLMVACHLLAVKTPRSKSGVSVSSWQKLNTMYAKSCEKPDMSLQRSSFTGEKTSMTLVAFIERPSNIETNGAIEAKISVDPQAQLEVNFMTVRPQVVDELLKRPPSYMVPRVYFSISYVPRTVNGKTDRAKLKDIASKFSMQQLTDPDVLNGEKQQPTNSAESLLQRLWAQVLNIRPDNVGIDGNFFQLGGDSIAAMKLVGQARQDGIATLTVADIFRLPSLRAQAQLHLQSDGLFRGVDATIDQTLPFSLLNSFIDPEGLLSLTLKHTGDYVLQSVLELADSDDFQFEALKVTWEETMLPKDGSLPWHLAKDVTLDDYLRADKMAPMGFGQPLTRFSLIGQNKVGNPRWFVWTVRHALYDGWSLPMIMNKASSEYNRLVNGLPPHEDAAEEVLPAFNSFVRYIESRKSEQSDRYWVSALSGTQAAPFPPLPASISQPAADTTFQQECKLSVEIQQRSSITTSTLVRAALGLLISRQTGVAEAAIGTALSGRNAPIAGIEKMVGPIIATVPLRIQVPVETPVSDYLNGVQPQATEMIPYEQTGLYHISKLGDDAQTKDEALSGRNSYGAWRTNSEQQGFTTYALTIECSPTAEGVTFQARFDSRVIEPWVTKRLLLQLTFVTQQLSEAPSNTKLGDMQTLPTQDKDIIWQWNAVVPQTIERCVHDIVQERINEQPDSPAVCAWDGEVTYRQLHNLSEELAHNLIEAGVSPGMIFPLYFSKSMWAVVGVLGVLKAGAAFAFLDAETQPKTRLRTIVGQTHATVICSSIVHQDLSRRLGNKIVLVGPDSVSRRRSGASNILPRVAPSSPLYLVFTSESTGQPKGAVVPHASFASALHYQLGPMNITRTSRVYDFASYSFDVAVHNVLATLAAGGCLCVPSDADRKTRLAESMEAMKANFVNLTSSVSRLIDPHEVPTLATLTLGDEPVRQDDAERWWGKVQLISSCEPSECTPMSVINVSANNPATLRDIGFGTGNLTWIVDPADHNILLPVGQVGELVLEGPLIGCGNLNDPTKTAAAFIETPTWLAAGTQTPPGRKGRLYKTGDLVCCNQDGSLQIVGRKDTHEVKVRGQRVEPEEVEHHLRRSLPGVEIAAETILIDGSSAAILAAFICLGSLSESQTQSSATLTTTIVSEAAMGEISTIATQLTEDLSRSLPPYMVPSIYVPLTAMPMTATDKTNRKQLRALAASLSRDQLEQMRGLGAGGDKRTPKADSECNLQSLWARVLNIPADTIGLDDGFFRLGGDSIPAMRLVGDARKLGMHFTVADVVDFYHDRPVPPAPDFSTYLAHLLRQRPSSSLHWKHHLAASHNSNLTSTLPPPVSSLQPNPPHRVQAESSVPLPELTDDIPISSFIGSAWAIILASLTRKNDVVFGHLVADRDTPIPGIQDIVGPCLHTIPIRIQIHPGRTPAKSILHAVHDQILSLRHAGLMMGGTDTIRSCTNWPAATSTLQSVLQHQNIDEHPGFLFGHSRAKLGSYDNPAAEPAALSLVSYPDRAGLRIRVLAGSRVMDAKMAGQLARLLCDAVASLASARDESVSGSFLDELRAEIHSGRLAERHGVSQKGTAVFLMIVRIVGLGYHYMQSIAHGRKFNRSQFDVAGFEVLLSLGLGWDKW